MHKYEKLIKLWCFKKLIKIYSSRNNFLQKYMSNNDKIVVIFA